MFYILCSITSANFRPWLIWFLTCYSWSLPSAGLDTAHFCIQQGSQKYSEVLQSLCWDFVCFKRKKDKSIIFLEFRKSRSTDQRCSHISYVTEQGFNGLQAPQSLTIRLLVMSMWIQRSTLAQSVTAIGYVRCKIQRALNQILLPLRVIYNL